MNKWVAFTLLSLSFPVFSGIDPKYYPGWPGDEKDIKTDFLLDRKTWPAQAGKHTGIRVIQDHHSLCFAAEQAMPRGHELVAAKTIPVKKGKLLKRIPLKELIKIQ